MAEALHHRWLPLRCLADQIVQRMVDLGVTASIRDGCGCNQGGPSDDRGSYQQNLAALPPSVLGRLGRLSRIGN